MNKCIDCKHWYDLDSDRKCQRVSKAYSQAAGYISTAKSSDGISKPKKLDSKIFEGTGMYSEACNKFLNVIESV